MSNLINNWEGVELQTWCSYGYRLFCCECYEEIDYQYHIDVVNKKHFSFKDNAYAAIALCKKAEERDWIYDKITNRAFCEICKEDKG